MLLAIMVLLEEGGAPPPPPTPPRRQSFGFGPAGGGGGGGGGYDWDCRLDPNSLFCPPEIPKVTFPTIERRRRLSHRADDPEAPAARLSNQLANVMRGSTGFSAAKTMIALAERHFGKHGGGLAAVASVVATSALTDKLAEHTEYGKKIEGPMIIGSVIAAVDDLVDIYVNERGEKPELVLVEDAKSFMARAQEHKSLTVTSRMGMSKTTGERVVVLRYVAAAKAPPRLYVYTEVVPMTRDGRYARGTLLEAIRRVVRS